jgi:ABC-type branched-subunit amino acid transport system substrate-binding protein
MSSAPKQAQNRAQARTLAALAAAVLLAVTLTSCTPAAPMPVPTVSPTATAAQRTALKIGTLFPVTGTASYLGPAQSDGVDAAVKDINAAGGVLGKPVQVFHDDSGDITTTTIETSLTDLQAKGADVIVGPSSSVLAERLFPKTLAARIPMITPSASSVRLSSLGASGYLYRTVPSAAAQGSVLAAAIGGGKAKLALVYLDDQTGQAVRATLTAGLAHSGGHLVTAQPFTTATADFAPIIAAVVAAAPDDVVLVSNFGTMAQNQAVITKLTAAGLGGAKLWLTSDNMADFSQALPAGALANVNGILEGIAASDAFNAKVKAVDPAVPNYLYAAESYDATVLAALAAQSAGNTSGASIASHLRSVSSGGIKCTGYAECLGVLATSSNIDYDGLTGAISFDSNGDPSPAHYGLYRYDAQNRFARVGSVSAP